MLPDIMFYNVKLYHIISYQITLHYILSYYVISCCDILHHIQLLYRCGYEREFNFLQLTILHLLFYFPFCPILFFRTFFLIQKNIPHFYHLHSMIFITNYLICFFSQIKQWNYISVFTQNSPLKKNGNQSIFMKFFIAKKRGKKYYYSYPRYFFPILL